MQREVRMQSGETSDEIAIQAIGPCPECKGKEGIEGEIPCAECRESGGGSRQLLLSPAQLAEILYPLLEAIDHRERLRRLEKLLAEMER